MSNAEGGQTTAEKHCRKMSDNVAHDDLFIIGLVNRWHEINHFMYYRIANKNLLNKLDDGWQISEVL
jgi:hypothetical protein